MSGKGEFAHKTPNGNN